MNEYSTVSETVSEENTLSLAKRLRLRAELDRASYLPPLPPDHVATTIEFFDGVGLLASESPAGVREFSRPEGYRPQYLALYIDGQLALFDEGGKILLNRIAGWVGAERVFNKGV
jgi:hypothetical protein